MARNLMALAFVLGAACAPLRVQVEGVPARIEIAQQAPKPCDCRCVPVTDAPGK